MIINIITLNSNIKPVITTICFKEKYTIFVVL